MKRRGNTGGPTGAPSDVITRWLGTTDLTTAVAAVGFFTTVGVMTVIAMGVLVPARWLGPWLVVSVSAVVVWGGVAVLRRVLWHRRQGPNHGRAR